MPLHILKQYFGYETFRPSQAEIIASILEGVPTLGILPTGGGKSLCFQVPALMLPSLSLVVSPLISLMKDQVDSLRESGVAADYINSSMAEKEYNQAIQRLREGQTRILYAAPERLQNPAFVNILTQAGVSMVAVDEAHCISQWGNDFRPAYLQIPRLLSQLGPGVRVSAFTATATPEVRQDILARLGMKGARVFVQGFDRPNLRLSVRHESDKTGYILDYLRNRRGQAGIIYASTRKEVDRLSMLLNKNRVKAGAYHAGMEAAQRKKAQEDFIYDRTPVMVATNAFGMGIDKPDVTFVIHYNLPGDLESYYQEAGRAGRDGSPAECVLLFSPGDIRTQEFFISQADVEDAIRQNRRRKLKVMVDYAYREDCLRQGILNYFGEKGAAEKCGNCSSCTEKKDTDITEVARSILTTVVLLEGKAGAVSVCEILKGSRSQKMQKMGWDTLSVHGVLRDRSLDELRAVVNSLCSQGLLKITTGKFPTLTYTPQGLEALKSGARLTTRTRVEPEVKAPSSPDQGLFERLRHLRKTLSDTEKVPPYVVFSDAVLREMARKRPRDREAFLAISGVGEAKLRRYGDLFLEVIREQSLQHREDTQPRSIPRVPVTERYLEYYERHARGESVENIARAMGVKPGTVLQNLLISAAQGKKLDYSRLLDPGEEKQILSAIQSVGDRYLKPIKESLPEHISYDAIRITIQKHKVSQS